VAGGIGGPYTRLAGVPGARTSTRANDGSHQNPTLGLRQHVSSGANGPSEQMSASAKSTAILTVLRSGSRESLDRLVPSLYEELRAIAHRRIAREPNGGTLETTGLVHEVYLKLLDQSGTGVHDRAHFLALASLAMRHVLVDRAKARGRLKRGGATGWVTFDDDRIAVDDQPEALLQLDDALSWLASLEPRLARVVECRFFGGLAEAEIAEALGVTERTVQRDWAKARMLLRRALES
jgi:RNA polymerase sigma factor (TIGR02999 family)